MVGADAVVEVEVDAAVADVADAVERGNPDGSSFVILKIRSASLTRPGGALTSVRSPRDARKVSSPGHQQCASRY